MKDYKPRREQPKRSGGAGLLMGILIGLILGLAVATAVAIYMAKTPAPFVNKTQPAPKAAAPDASRSLADAARSAGDAAKAASTDKPRFDFYKILPGQEVPVTDKELRQAAKEPAKPGAPRDLYFVQAGAFQNPADADNLKARLAFMGLQAAVEPASLPDKGTWYRVRLGPYAQLDEINRVRQTLAQNGVEASLVKVKPN